MKFQYKIPDSPCLRRTLSFCRSRRHINSCTPLERSWKQMLMWTLIIILLSLLLLSLMTLITGFTYPPTLYFKFITKCDKCYYKVRQLFYYKVRHVLLQSVTGITKCDNFIAKCDRYYKVQQYTRAFFCAFLYRSRKSACKITIFQVLQRTLTLRRKFEFFFLALTPHL